MPITIRTLIEGRDRPITASAEASVKHALEVMLRHDFTQLPVTDSNDAVLGMVTSDSILRALDAFRVEPHDLRVRDAMRQIDVYDPDDDITELLDGLRDSYAAVVVGSDKRIIAIVTGFDTAEHFRRQFEDLMLVQDIESAIKEHVQFAFARLGLAQDDIDVAIRRVGDPEDRVRAKIRDAVKLYAAKACNAAVDEGVLTSATVAVTGKSKAVTFDRLTLAQYIELLLSDQCWTVLHPIYDGMQQGTLRKLLNSVQRSRNAIAHFRGQLTALDRSHLRVCAEWFGQHSLPPTAPPVAATTVAVDNEEIDLVPAEESSDAGQGRYARLADWLMKRPGTETTVTLTFDEVEGLIQSPLPRSAFAHRSWWANDSVSHPQSVNWLDVGWRVANLNLTNRVVTFSRFEGRQGAYIGFFSAALNDLRTRASWGVAGQSPSGANWQVLAGMTVDGRQQVAILAWAFARRKRFRTELYIDSGDAASNKRLFDSLRANQTSIEAKVGQALTWERMDERRASRIAIYTDGTIQDSVSHLVKLRTWAVDTALVMHEALLEGVRTCGVSVNQAGAQISPV